MLPHLRLIDFKNSTFDFVIRHSALYLQGRIRNLPMLKIFNMFYLITFLVNPSFTFAIDYEYKKIDSFKKLESFKSVEEFELYYNKYIQDCLDHTGGGTGGIPCFKSYEIWDRELNIYYEKLINILGKKEKQMLKASQLAWIKERDKSIEFNSKLLDIEYKNEMGTMYALMRAGDADRLITPIVKQRALQLKNWFEFVENQSK